MILPDNAEPDPMGGTARVGRPALMNLLSVVFFVSGAAGLMFETIWFRLAGLAFGNSVWAGTVVLCSFMGGLALGNFLAARFRHLISRPVRLYAVMEFLVGVCGTALVFALPLSSELLAPLLGRLLENAWYLNALRLFVSFCLMVVPATAMGMTLPLIVKALYEELPAFGRVLGRLYGWNTLGAVVGSLAGEVVFIQWLGVKGTAMFAGTLNLLAAAVAMGLSRRMERSDVQDGPGTSAVRFRSLIRTPREARVLAGAFLSGGILLAFEVVWFRFALLYIRGDSLAFALMLAVVLAGIGLGGLVGALLLRRNGRAHEYMPAVALMCGIVSIAVYTALDYVPLPPREVLPEWMFNLAFCLRIMFPASFFSGILFTFMGEAVHEEIGDSLEAGGLLTMANTAGAMFGSAFAGLVLLAGLGLERSFVGLSACYGVVAVLIGSQAGGARERKHLYWSYAAGALLVAVLILFPFGSMERHILSVGIRTCSPALGWKPIAVREGLTETSQYWRREAFGKPIHGRLLTNNHSMSSSGIEAKRYMNLYVYLPMAVHPSAERALLICYGIGNTCKALTDTRSLKHIDVVDISRDILEVGDFVFPDPVQAPLNDPRVHVHIEDGRFFLLAGKRKYDLITAEPPPPQMAGIVNLYSEEYFRLIYERLAEGGIVTYWLPVGQLSESAAKGVLKAFADVFPDCTLWTAVGLEWMMVGSRNARGPVTEEAFSRQWNDPVVGPEIRRCGFESPEQIGTTFMMDAEALKAWTSDSQPVVDNFPRRIVGWPVMYDEPVLSVYEQMMKAEPCSENFRRSEFVKRLWPDSLRSRTLAGFHLQEMVNRVFMNRFRRGMRLRHSSMAINLVDAMLTGSTVRFPIFWAMGGEYYTDLDHVVSDADQQKLSESPEGARLLALRALARRDYLLAEKHFSEEESFRPNPRIAYFRTYLLCKAGRSEDAAALIRKNRALYGDERGQAYLQWLAKAFNCSNILLSSQR